MTIANENRKAGPFEGNGVSTVFPFEFKVFQGDELLVIHADTDGVESTLIYGQDYSVSLNADQDAAPGGSLELVAPLEVGAVLVITSDVRYLQPTHLTNQGGFYPEVINAALDRLTILAQQNEERLSRAITVQITGNIPADEYRDSLIAASVAAVDAADAAGTSAANAKNSENAAALSEANAKDSENAAALSEANAKDSEDAAALSEANAKDSEDAAALSEANAKDSEIAAKTSEVNAKDSEDAAGTSAANAKVSENAAAASETEAKQSELAAKFYFESLVQPFAFFKPDYDTPCFAKTGAETLAIKAGTTIVVDGVARVFTVPTPVAMPAFVPGSDYSVWVLPDSTAQAVPDPYSAPAAPPAPGAVKIGGFHYGLVAPGETVAGGGFSTSGVTDAGGSMAWTQADVDRIAGINEFTLWDLAFHCTGEQRGMAYDPVADVWAAIYFMGTTPHIDGPSAYNTDIASGTVLPFIPPAWGGDGVLKYSAMNSWTANELATAFGHRLIRYEEFTSVAFGVTEGQSLGGPESTIPATKREPGYTSRIGLEQATGHQFVIGGPIHSVGGSSWSGTGRGSWYGGSGMVRLGGNRDNTSSSGSRCARFNSALSHSNWSNSLRAASDPKKIIGPALYSGGQ